MFQRIINTSNDFTLTVLRVVLGVVFFAHGAQKMLGWFGGRGFGDSMVFFTQKLGIPGPIAAGAIVIEFFCGLALIVGLLGRIATLGIIAKMIVAIQGQALRNGFFMNWSGSDRGEGYEFHLLVIALALAILIKGSGALSVDRLLCKTDSSKSG